MAIKTSTVSAVSLIGIGVLCLMHNLQWAFFNAGILFRYALPAFLIYLGLQIMLKNNTNKNPILLVASLLLFMGLGAFGISKKDKHFESNNWIDELHNFGDTFDNKPNDEDNSGSNFDFEESQTYQFDEPFDSQITNAKLNIELANGAFKLKQNTDELVATTAQSTYDAFGFTVEKPSNTQANIFVNLSKNTTENTNPDAKNEVEISLNKQPTWDINLSTNATQSTIDLSQFKTETINLNTKTSNIDLTIGDNASQTTINIESDVSNFIIEIPEQSGCQIITKKDLTDPSFDTFEQKTKGVFQTANFDTATKKILINLNIDASNIKINRN